MRVLHSFRALSSSDIRDLNRHACACICLVAICMQVFQVVLSFMVFPKPLSWKYFLGGLLVATALYCLNKFGTKKQFATMAVQGGGGGSGGSTEAPNGSALVVAISAATTQELHARP
jgi:hypothetical protein